MTQTLLFSGWTPQQVTLGAEVQALTQFLSDCRWSGTMYEGMQGPGSPEMQTSGGMRCRWLTDGLWLACERFQDQFVEGVKVLTRKLHLIVGWDTVAHEYRALQVDNTGTSALLRGEIAGATLVLQPIDRLQAGGHMPALRIVWDATDTERVLWRSATSTDGTTWLTIEDHVITPV